MEKQNFISVSARWMRSWFLLFLLGLAALAWAAPDYVTNWPKQVPVEKPDPVLGDKPFWEFWVYSESFAKRFKGFPVEKANPELKNGLRAMVFRIYKTNLWQGLNPDYPEQYACEWDVYFDNSLVVPLTGRPKGFTPTPYPKHVSASYARLDPHEVSDRQALKASQPVASNPKQAPLVFATPLDGRYKSYRVREYRPEFVSGLAVLIFEAGMNCEATAPLQEGGSHWLSLQGERPYSRHKDGKDPTLWGAVHGSYQSGIKSTFDPSLHTKSKGYFRVPEAFNKAALPKVTLVKVLNWCINQRYARDTRPIHIKGMSDEAWQAFDARCRAVEEHGVIDSTTYPGKAATGNTGF